MPVYQQSRLAQWDVRPPQSERSEQRIVNVTTDVARTQRQLIASNIVYTGRVMVRPTGYVPTGSPGVPLILRNPQNDNTKLDYLKDGPSVTLKFGPSDYRMLAEALTDQTGALTNYIFWWLSTNGVDWAQSGTQPVLTPNGAATWENGEICPCDWLVDPLTGEHLLYYHGGGNSPGKRQIGLFTSTGGGLPGTWTRYNSATPIIANGGAGSWNENGVADMKVRRLSATLWMGILKGFRADGKTQLGVYFSTDGRTGWTDFGTNPILPLGSGNDVFSLNGCGIDVDALGRVHIFYPGVDSGGINQRVLYAYSDDWLNWVRNPSDVLATTSATAGDSDAGSIGDVVTTFNDDGILMHQMMNFNFSAYAGDAKGRLEGRGWYYDARIAATQPAGGYCARFVQIATTAARGYLTLPTAAKLLDQSTFCIYTSFRCPPGSASRPWYVESANFNQLINFGLNADGNFGNTNGRSMCRYRTPTSTVTFTTSTRYDDNKRHYAVFRRYSAASWDLLVDGTVIATSVVNPATDATNPTFNTLLGPHPSDSTNYPLVGYPTTAAPGVNTGWGGMVVDRFVSIAGYAMSDAEAATLWNAGVPGGAVPASGTVRLNVGLGNGNQAGPDIDAGPNKSSLAVVNAAMIDFTPVAISTSTTFSVTASGGITTSGAGTYSRAMIATPSGGLQSAGGAALAVRKVSTPAGGITMAGAATVARRVAVAASGGLQSGGAATLARRRAPTVSGGLQSGGAAALSVRKVSTASGGATFAGAASLAVRKVATPSGGAVFAGAAAIARRKVSTPAGGATFGGAGTFAVRKVAVAAGGAIFGGAATVTRPGSNVYGATGGIVTSGAAALARRKAPTISGGALFAGAAAIARRVVAVASGGATFTGAAAIARRRAPTVSGGGVFAGTATIARRLVAVAVGGILLSGAATTARRKTVAPAGGAVFGGGASVSFSGVRNYPVTATGGATFSGAAAVARRKIVATSGGLQTSGAASLALRKVATPAGGMSSSGVALVRRGIAKTATGGIVIAGAATVTRVGAYNVTASGGLQSGGAASVLRRRVALAIGGLTYGGAASVTGSNGGPVYALVPGPRYVLLLPTATTVVLLGTATTVTLLGEG